MHRFIYIEVLLMTGSDVIAESPSGGAACTFQVQILKERTQFHVRVLLTLFVNLQTVKKLFNFFVLAGIPH